MKKIGLIQALRLTARYRKMDVPARERQQMERLRALVEWAKANSPYYARLYRDLPEDFRLIDLPPVSKADLMPHFDEWVTDRSVTLSDVRAFMEDMDNVGRRMHGKYLVFTTSGSTGNPLIMLADKSVSNVMSAVNALRAIARREDMKALLKRGNRTMGVFATGGFYLSNGSVKALHRSMPWKKRQMQITSALKPIPEIVEQLNRFQPAMLGGYPTNLELLIDEKKSRRLTIRPALIMTGGETLSDELRARLSEVFGCSVQTSYACTEGGTIAAECREKRFHVNDDWVIVEPVDSNNHPVPDGVQADKILLTNLYNFTQPVIRYEVTDRVVMHHERCACGNPSPWLTVEGRTDDVLTFEGPNGEVRVAPLPIYATLKEVGMLRRFQVVAKGGNKIELRLEPNADADPDAAFKAARDGLAAFIATQGAADIEIERSSEKPRQMEGSGKYKHIINLVK